MCQLMGMSFNREVNPDISFKGFCQRGTSNPHGWGTAFWPDGKAVSVFKEPLPAHKSHSPEIIRQLPEFSSNIFIFHVRWASVGGVCYSNTHPFFREMDGKDWAFAHNGSINKNAGLRPKIKLHFQPVGQTDSELAFCYLLSEIKEKKIKEWNQENYLWLHKLIINMNQYGGFNCLFSDGQKLFAYHDFNGYNGLWRLNREAPFDVIHMIDEDYSINLKYEKDEKQQGFLIASHPLSNEKWEKFNPGELCVFEKGTLIFRKN